MYGNEEAVGLGIRKSGVPREKIFLTTKLMDSGGFRNSLRDIGDSLRIFCSSMSRMAGSTKSTVPWSRHSRTAGPAR